MQPSQAKYIGYSGLVHRLYDAATGEISVSEREKLYKEIDNATSKLKNMEKIYALGCADQILNAFNRHKTAESDNLAKWVAGNSGEGGKNHQESAI